MTVYALERANNDLIVFLLILYAATLFVSRQPYRLYSYVLFFVAGILKYYPLVFLVLLTRERRRDAVALVTVISEALISLSIYFHVELGKALANIPASSYFSDSFSAENLPFGFGEAMGAGFSRFAIDALLLSLLIAVAAARTIRTARLLDKEKLDWNEEEMQWLTIAGMLLTACFFAGQNINYRGIYILLLLPGLVQLHRCAGKPMIRLFSAQMIVATLFLMWEEFFRRVLHAIVAPKTNEGLKLPEVYFWIGRELAWWWLVAGLVAIILVSLRRSYLEVSARRNSTLTGSIAKDRGSTAPVSALSRNASGDEE
jgi:hypothetical protein